MPPDVAILPGVRLVPGATKHSGPRWRVFAENFGVYGVRKVWRHVSMCQSEGAPQPIKWVQSARAPIRLFTNLGSTSRIARRRSVQFRSDLFARHGKHAQRLRWHPFVHRKFERRPRLHIS